MPKRIMTTWERAFHALTQEIQSSQQGAEEAARVANDLAEQQQLNTLLSRAFRAQELKLDDHGTRRIEQ